MISFDASVCCDYEAASSREWLETNGIGGFACGTISGANIRRYNGLLTAAANPPLGRISMLSKYEESVFINGERFDLSTNLFPGTVHPEGYKLLSSFRLDPFPIWTYSFRGIVLEKRLFMIYGRNAVAASWRVVSSDVGLAPISLELKPLISFVDYHHLQHGNNDLDGHVVSVGNAVTMRPYPELPSIVFTHNASSEELTGYWYRNFEYVIEKERGFDCQEDLFQPFVLKFDLASPASVIASAGEAVSGDVDALEAEVIRRRLEITDNLSASDPLADTLAIAADQFIVRRGDGHTVIAGYPWFSDWGRDTMISLRG